MTFVGDLANGRTVHSLARLLTHYVISLRFVSPQKLKMPDEVKSYVRRKGIQYKEISSLEEVLPETDVLYMTRIQRETFRQRRRVQRVLRSLRDYASADDQSKDPYDCNASVAPTQRNTVSSDASLLSLTTSSLLLDLTSIMTKGPHISDKQKEECMSGWLFWQWFWANVDSWNIKFLHFIHLFFYFICSLMLRLEVEPNSCSK